jgi:hypothetical protein
LIFPEGKTCFLWKKKTMEVRFMKVKLEILGPAKKKMESNPAEIELPKGSKVKDLMKTVGYTDIELKYLVYVRGDDTIKPTAALSNGDYVKAVLQLGGG